ncbi:MAG: polysaccharide biosynthesis C-terminal domain-containing protein [Bacteroidota bacterium]
MKNKFISSISLLVLLNMLIKPAYVFIIEPAVQNRVGNIDYGFYFSLFGFSFIFNTILDLGVTHFNNRDIARHPQLLTRYFNRIIALKLVLSGIYVIMLLGIGWIAGYSSEQFRLLFIILINQILASITLYLRSNITALHLFKTDSALSVADKILMIGICATMLWTDLFGEFTVYHFVFAQTASYLVTAILAFTIVIFKLERFSIAFDVDYFTIFLRKSFPFALMIFLMASYKWFDSFIIERILPGHQGKEQAGIYAQSFRLLDGVTQFSYLFSIVLLPMFSRMIKENQAVFRLVKVASLILIIPVLILSLTTAFFRQEIIELFYHTDHLHSSTILGILILSFPFISSNYVFGTLLTANGSLSTLNKLAATALAINIALNLILIPKFNAVGCALASLTTQFFMAITQYAFARKYFNIKLNIPVLVKSFFLIVFIVGLGSFNHSVPLSWPIQYLGIMFLSVVLAFSMGLIRFKYFRQTFLNESADNVG